MMDDVGYDFHHYTFPTPCMCLTLSSSRPSSKEEQSRFGILHHPPQPLLQIHPRHRTARHNRPLVCLDRIQLQPLCTVTIGPATPLYHRIVLLTCLTSSSVMAPGTSLLFLKTRRLAPERRCRKRRRSACYGAVSAREDGYAYLFEKQACQLLSTVVDALAVGGIDDPDERVRLLKVVLPVRA